MLKVFSFRNRNEKIYITLRHGVLKIDGALVSEAEAMGQTKSIEVQPAFYLGHVLPETLQINVVQKNLQVRKYG